MKLFAEKHGGRWSASETNGNAPRMIKRKFEFLLDSAHFFSLHNPLGTVYEVKG